MTAKDWLDSVALAYDSEACLLFPFSVGSHGYGQFQARRLSNQPILAHRYVCTKKHGDPPLGDWIAAAHSCGNRRCVNPRHVRWATYEENEADKLQHGRRVRGETHQWARLTKENAAAILHATGVPQDIADQFGVSKQTVYDIKRRRSWKHL